MAIEENVCGWCLMRIYRRSPSLPWRTVWIESCDSASCARPDGNWVNDGHEPMNLGGA